MLTTKARCFPGKYLYLPIDVRTETELAGFSNCQASILATPRIGASFADYLLTTQGDNRKIGLPCIKPNMERFIYLVEGSVTLSMSDRSVEMFKNGYAYIPPEMKVNLYTKGNGKIMIYYWIHRYWRDGNDNVPELILGNADMIGKIRVNGEHSQKTRKLFPEKAVFDLSANILNFEPGIGFEQMESHVQEHSIYMLEGEACFYLDHEWIPMEKGDYLWLGSYVPHCCYGTGIEEFSYLLMKDNHRNYQELL